MKPHHILSRLVMLLALGLGPGSVVVYAQPGAQAEQPEPKTNAVDPPASLAPLLDRLRQQAKDADHAAMPLKQALTTIKPTPLPKPEQGARPGLTGPAVEQLLERARASIERGEVFAAIELLREAERQAPDSLAVARELGIAYMASGNRVRGAKVLGRVLASDQTDTGVLALLCQHAAKRGDLSAALGYADALESAKLNALADLYRAEAFETAGYTRAAATALSLSLIAAELIDEKELAADDKLDPIVLREQRVLKTLTPQLKVRLGDLLLVLGDLEQAGEAYASVDPAGVADGGALIARRAYVALLAGDQAGAIDLVVGLLDSSSATTGDAALVRYLVEHGVSAEALAGRLAGSLKAHGATLPLLAGYAAVAKPQASIAAIAGWLAARPAEPALLREAAELIDLNDDDPADAEPLAGLLALTADQMRNEPDQARRFADAMVGQIDELVCLLRAVKRPEFDKPDDAYRMLLSAIAYHHAGRTQDAIDHYDRAGRLDPAVMPHARLALAELLIDSGQGERALAVLRGGDEQDWDHFALTARAMSAVGDHRDALRLIDAWLSAHGETVPTRLLQAQLLAAAGEPRSACDRLIALVRTHPLDQRPYRLALKLIEQHLQEFPSIGNAISTRNAFLSLLQQNLPDSPTARVERAIEIYDDPANAREAERLLLGALADEPDNLLAISLLVSVYDLSNQHDKAEQLRERFSTIGRPGLERDLSRAAAAVRDGEMERASTILRGLMALEEEGVLPGPAMTGDDAASLVQLLSAADPDFDEEAMTLAMVRRFPRNAQLNNALGYKWAVAGKNLLQAKAMIQRALDQDNQNASVLDSMAWVQYKLGEFARAEAYQKQALEALALQQRMTGDALRASKAVLYDHMGDILYQQGEVNAAIRQWQIARAQRLEPEDLMLEPELRTLSARVNAKIDAAQAEEKAPVEPVPGKEAHGPDGHPADLPNEPAEPE